MIKMIVAHDENNVIGNNNSIPWTNKEDLKLFKTITTNNTVVMGRKTWDSLPKKPLPNRRNVVVTRQSLESTPDVTYVSTLFDAIFHPNNIGDVYIIGGEQLYNYALQSDVVEEILVSLIPESHVGDRFFPKLDMYKAWYKLLVKNYSTFKHITYVRNRGHLNGTY
jgi:dihydrofolate reductase